MKETPFERLQAKVEEELEKWEKELACKEPEKIMDAAYELSVKRELAVQLDCAFLDRFQIKALLEKEFPLQHIYEHWEADHAMIGDLLTDTICEAGQAAKEEQRAQRKGERREIR